MRTLDRMKETSTRIGFVYGKEISFYIL